MFKLFLLLGCINLLVIADTNVFENTVGTHKTASAKLAMNKTNTESTVPLMFVETKSGQIKKVNSGNEFSCPDGYTFLSFLDDANNLLDVCRALPGNGGSFRLQGGGSATSPVYSSELSTTFNQTFRCDAVEAGIVALDQAVCAKTEIVDRTTEEGDGNCPEGYDVINIEETKANRKALCDTLDKWGIYRIGMRGSLSGSGYECQERDFDDRTMGATICVRRQINDIKLADIPEASLCGQGRRPINAQEALDNRDAVCKLLGDWEIIRIGGGGSFDGPGYGCGLRELDRRGLGGVLCAPDNTAQ